MSEAVRHALLILFVLACFAFVGDIDRRVAEEEAAAAVQSFTITSTADQLPDGAPVDRFAVVPLEPRGDR